MNCDSLNILGRIVPVKIGETDDGNCGEYHKKAITIIDGLSDEDFMVTLLHEGGHAFFDRIGLTGHIHSTTEEVIVEGFATWITENFDIRFKNEGGRG
jgi:hypothetical protein